MTMLHWPRPSWLHPRFRYEQSDKIHVVRLSAAILVAQIIAAFTQEPHSVWMSVTIIVVMGSQPHTGSIIEKARQRTVGTTIGALAGIVTILASHHSTLLAQLMIIVFSAGAAYKAIGKAGYTALVSAITMSIVSSSGTLEVGVWRFLSVISGVAIAILFARVIPARARVHWYYLLADNVRDLALLFRRLNRSALAEPVLVDGIIKRIVTQRGLLAATANESAVDVPTLNDLLRRQRAILHTIDMFAGEDGDWPGSEVSHAMLVEAEAQVAAHFTRLGELVGLTLVNIGETDNVPMPPQKYWLLGRLATQLEGYCSALEGVVQRLAGDALASAE